VDFIYTGCQSLCRALGTEFQQLQHDIVERGQQHRVHLLSVSFDPEHDGPATLRSYAEHMQGNVDVWTFATVANVADLDRLLQTFGVTVIPDRLGGFQHNAALVWVSPSARLVRVMDFNDGHFRLPDGLPRPN
jgi:protein SCO1/2